ncbi:helix-turn-helix domain-containing protein [Clostridium sp. DSM 100503]|uniref:helix-turn-helix transcriptional regulator n=1 Tax=Clostridium sp. DSM 100503 TaxID=2963282 RepID=UPI00214A7C7D|nr:helix-turn-helix domain-containing protein [Clostridium sp. DSM 100503]MCR1952934.1 helix-turn-helix domain-containing protein [Clostridium sp. DSM 100503]
MRKILKKIRLEKGFTHQSISDILEINRATYSKIELGYKNPSLILALKIKAVLDYSEDDIFLNS